VLFELGVEFVLGGRVGGEVVEGVAEDETLCQKLISTSNRLFRWQHLLLPRTSRGAAIFSPVSFTC
jgi:hypothetical protein